VWPFDLIRNRRERHEQAVTDALVRHGEMRGSALQEASGISNVGTFYVTLMRLEDAGRIKSRWGEATAARNWRRPRIYSLNVP
jgi:DNA-binding PadR family transcriptional regulator